MTNLNRDELKKSLLWMYYILPVVLYAGFIFYISSLESLSTPQLGLNIEDKLMHFGAYFVLGWLITRSFHFGKSHPVSKKLFLIAILLGSLYGLSDEFHQHFVPGRYPEFWDWFCDTVGITMGVVCYQRFYYLENHIIQLASKSLR